MQDLYIPLYSNKRIALLARTVEYTDCPSPEGYDPPLNRCPRYDSKQSDSEVAVMLRLWGMHSTSSLPLLPGPLWPRMIAPDRAPSIG